MPTESNPSDVRRFAPAAQRNKEAILAVLPRHLPQDGVVVEIASGSGEHAAHIAPRLPGTLAWQPTDLDPDALAGIDAHAADSGSTRIRPARQIDVSQTGWHHDLTADAVFCANMIHIAPWHAAQGLINGSGELLPMGGVLLLYGPFRRNGAHTAPSNEAFDGWLKQRDAAWGVRDLEGEVLPLAHATGFGLRAIETMPANNLIVVLEKGVPA